MEAMATSSSRAASSSALLLEHAFGKRLVNGEDEWQCVDSVVRSSFLLLYREYRRHAKKLSILEANQRAARDEWVTLMHEQLHLHNEERQLIKAELSDLRSRSGVGCKCPCEQKTTTINSQQLAMAPIAAFAQRQLRCHQKLRRKVTKLQSQLRNARRAQHECDKIVVRTAEKQQRQVHSLAKKLHGESTRRERLENTIHEIVMPRLETMATRAVVMPTQVCKAADHSGAKQGQGTQQDAVKSAAPLAFKHEQHDRVVPIVPSSASTHRSCVDEPASMFAPKRSDAHYAHEYRERQSHALSPPPSPSPPTPVLLSTGHASLRRRYQRERRHQIRRLDRLRFMEAHVVVATTPKHNERSEVR